MPARLQGRVQGFTRIFPACGSHADGIRPDGQDKQIGESENLVSEYGRLSFIICSRRYGFYEMPRDFTFG